MPKGPGSDLLRDLMQHSRAVLRDHPTNQHNAVPPANARDATQIWLWDKGRAPSLKPFAELYAGKKGAILSAVDLVRGVGILLGWTRIDVPGTTGYLDTDYAAKGRYGVEALKTHDLVCVHVEAPDEASHEGKADEKVKALERIDEHIVGPLSARSAAEPWRVADFGIAGPSHAAQDAGACAWHGAVRRRRNRRIAARAGEL